MSNTFRLIRPSNHLPLHRRYYRHLVPHCGCRSEESLVRSQVTYSAIVLSMACAVQARNVSSTSTRLLSNCLQFGLGVFPFCVVTHQQFLIYLSMLSLLPLWHLEDVSSYLSAFRACCQTVAFGFPSINFAFSKRVDPPVFPREQVNRNHFGHDQNRIHWYCFYILRFGMLSISALVILCM